MTSTEGEHRSREQWQRTPHPYEVEYPHYPCLRCGCWPGYPIHHKTSAGSDAPTPNRPATIGTHRES